MKRISCSISRPCLSFGFDISNAARILAIASHIVPSANSLPTHILPIPCQTTVIIMLCLAHRRPQPKAMLSDHVSPRPWGFGKNLSGMNLFGSLNLVSSKDIALSVCKPRLETSIHRLTSSSQELYFHGECATLGIRHPRWRNVAPREERQDAIWVATHSQLWFNPKGATNLMVSLTKQSIYGSVSRSVKSGSLSRPTTRSISVRARFCTSGFNIIHAMNVLKLCHV